MDRILHIPGCESMNRSNGINSFLMNVFRNIDRSRYLFDFVVYGTEPGDYDDEIKALGGKIFYTASPGTDLIKNARQMFQIMRKGQYQIVHRHTATSLCWMDFFMARLAGIRIRVCHSHGNYCEKIWLHKIFYPIFMLNITGYLACGEEAGKWLYRNRRSFSIIKNGIDTEQYKYDEKKRHTIRGKYKIKDSSLVIGTIGRISEQKNPLFLIDLFAEIVKIQNNSVCVFVGDGNLMAEVKDKVRMLNLTDKVIFAGVSSDIQGWLSAIDVVVYPSLYEGFPVAVLESEAAGVPAVLSDKVPGEVDVTGLSRQVPLSSTAKQWAEEVVLQTASHDNLTERYNYNMRVRKNGYDIKQTARELEKYYDMVLLKQRERKRE